MDFIFCLIVQSSNYRLLLFFLYWFSFRFAIKIHFHNFFPSKYRLNFVLLLCPNLTEMFFSIKISPLFYQSIFFLWKYRLYFVLSFKISTLFYFSILHGYVIFLSKYYSLSCFPSKYSLSFDFFFSIKNKISFRIFTIKIST